MFSCEFSKISKNNFLLQKPPVVASADFKLLNTKSKQSKYFLDTDSLIGLYLFVSFYYFFELN